MRKPRAFDRAGPHIHSPRLAPWDPSPPTALAAEARGPGGGRCSARGGVRRPPGPTPPADPGRGGGRRDRGGPIRAGGAPPAHEGQGCGPVRAPDVGVHGDPRAPLRQARSVEGAASGPLPDQGGPSARGRRAAERPAPAGVRAARRGDQARPRSRHGSLVLVLRAAPGARVDPASQPGAVPARRPADGRRVRHRLRDLFRDSHRAALVGGGGGLHPGPRGPRGPRERGDRRRLDAAAGPARDGRGGGADLGSRLARPLLLARRQPVGGDALPALRRPPCWRRCCSRSRGRSAGVAGWSYALTLGFALVYLGEHYLDRSAGGGGLWSSWSGGASRSPARSRTGSVAWRSGSSGSRTAERPAAAACSPGRLADKRTAGPPGSIRGDGERP